MVLGGGYYLKNMNFYICILWLFPWGHNVWSKSDDDDAHVDIFWEVGIVYVGKIMSKWSMLICEAC